MFRSVDAGVSEHISFQTFTTAELKAKLLKILTDPNYSRRMKLRSQRLRDQPEKPIDRAVWWVEYLLRNPDASFLRVPTTELGFFRANSLDLYGIVFLILLALFIVVIYLMRLGVQNLLGNGHRLTKKVKNN